LPDHVKPPSRMSRRGALLLAGVAMMAPLLARSADPISTSVPEPPRRIGVRPFDVTPSFASAGDADAAAIIEAALISRLEDTGCCKVVERAARPIADGATAPTRGVVLPARFIVAGSLTIDSPPDVGGITAFDGPGRGRGSVEIDVRLSDARTGMVLGVFQAERRISVSRVSERPGAPARAEAFFASPLGQATDLALADVVGQIAGALAALR
jgi:curli biogenesis system outer membrane secretion channel CsgG